MEYVGAAFLIVVGLFFLPWGRTARTSSRALPAWLDLLILWGMSLTCLWFGAALLLGRARF